MKYINDIYVIQVSIGYIKLYKVYKYKVYKYL